MNDRSKSYNDVKSFVSSSQKDLHQSLPTDFFHDEVVTERTLDTTAASTVHSPSDPSLLESIEVRTRERRKNFKRREGLFRPHCDYGMDVVGDHIGVVGSWIELVHRTAPGYLKASWSNIRCVVAMSDSFDNRDESNLLSDSSLPLGVNVHDGLEDAFRGLSRCVAAAMEKEEIHALESDGNLGEGPESRQRQRRASGGEAQIIVEAVARIPGLMKTILLIEDENDRNKILRMPIIRRVMLCRFSVMSQEAIQDSVHFDVKAHPEDHHDDSPAKQFNLAHLMKLKRIRRRKGNRRISHHIASSEALGIFNDSAKQQSSWLVEMLKSGDKTLANIAIDYLEMISELSVEDYLSALFSRPENEDDDKRSPDSFVSKSYVKEFEEEKDKLFRTIDGFRYLLPHLFALGDEFIERASVTAIVSHVLDDTIAMPFPTIIIFLDFLFRILLTLSFRYQTQAQIEKKERKVGFLSGEYYFESIDHFGMRLVDLAFVVSFYYVFIRLVGEWIAMLRVSWRVFLRFMFSFWVMVEFSVLILTGVVALIHSTSEGTSYETELFYRVSAITIGLLWLNFIGFLQVMNKKLAVFILATSQILWDIVLFLVIVLVVIIAFGDMFYTISSTERSICSGDGDGSEEENPFCQNIGMSYLAVYRVFVGDFELDDFGGSLITRSLFVVLTFMGVIILLNMLIAIADESYERSSLKASQFFGRARVGFVARVTALEDLFHPNDKDGNGQRDSRMEKIQKYSMKVLYVVSDLSTFMTCAAALSAFFHWAEGTISATASVVIVVIVMVPLLYLELVLISYLYTGWRTRDQRGRFMKYFQYNPFIRHFIEAPVYWFVSLLLGRTAKSVTSTDEGEAWSGRIRHIERHVRETVTESEERTGKTLISLKDRMEMIERQVSSLMNFVKEKEEQAKVERLAELEAFEARIVQSVVTALSKPQEG